MTKHYRLLFVCFLKSFFLCARHSFVPLLCALLLLFSADCGLTESDLKYSHPSTPIIKICDKPLDVPDDVNLWGYNSFSKRLVTAEDPAELRGFYSADMFFEYDADAPASNLKWAPPKWGLTCATPVTFLADESEFLPRKEPCSATVAQAGGRPDTRWLGQTTGGKPPCDPPVQAKRKAPVRVHVCVRPPSVGDVSEWGIFLKGKGERWTFSATDYAKDAEKADIIFVFDENARPETAYYFVKDPKDPKGLRCKDKPAPKPYDEVVGSEDVPMLAEVTAARAAQGNPKKGDGQTTETSGPNGKGPPLDFLDVLTRNLQYAAALASGDTSGNPKDPNGSRYGSLSGKNVGGPNLQILQAITGTFALITNPFKMGKNFIEAVKAALKGGKVAVILDPKVLTKEIAEELAKAPTETQLDKALKGEIVESYGMAMAISLRDAGVILPYSRAQIFTKGWEAKFQAHHILEVNMFKTLGKEELAKDGPAVILSKAEHEVITDDLKKARDALMSTLKDGQAPTPAQVWAMYQKVYKKYPNWLKAIEHYFQ